MIYCIEDDSNIRDLVVYALNAGGFQAVGFESSLPFWQRMKEERPELILLDIMLPGEDGISVLKKLRSSPLTMDIPVIMTTAKGTEYDKVIGLDSGADDYLVKPFGMLEMVSRIKAVMRRTAKSDVPAVLTAGPLSMDINKHLVQVIAQDINMRLAQGDTQDINKFPSQHTNMRPAQGSMQNITLTLKEFNILRLLLENQGRVFSRDQLLENVWGIDFAGETRTVDVHIGTLRTKLGAAGSLIQTVHGVGYKLGVPHDK